MIHIDLSTLRILVFRIGLSSTKRITIYILEQVEIEDVGTKIVTNALPQKTSLQYS